MILEPQFRTSRSEHLWSSRARLARMIAFEVELAAAEAEVGLIPSSAAEAIRAAAGAEGLDAETIFLAARDAGNPAIPFAASFTAHVTSLDRDAGRYVHFGATSQDVIDTAMMLALAATVAAVRSDLARAIERLQQLASDHAATPIAARTLLQQATPITFGAKAADWCRGLTRAEARLEGLSAGDLVVQLAGASGTLAVLHPHGPAVRAGLARRLGLADPGGNWQTLRDPVLTVASALASTIALAGKIAGDLQFLAATEIGEVAEGLRAGGGGSSAMPHKRNPVDSLVPVAAAAIAPGLVAGLGAASQQEQERSPGRWHAEWVLLPLLSTLALASADRLAALLDGLTVDPSRMAENLDHLNGLLASEALSSALAKQLGRTEAKAISAELVERVRTGQGHLRAIAAADPRVTAVLTAADLADIFEFRAAIAAAEAEALR